VFRRSRGADPEKLAKEKQRLEEEASKLEREVAKLRKLVEGLKEQREEAIKEAFNLFRDWFYETNEIIVLNILRRAAEKPPIWWQWLMLIAVGVLGGLGLGYFIASLHKPEVVVPNVTVRWLPPG